MSMEHDVEQVINMSEDRIRSFERKLDKIDEKLDTFIANMREDFAILKTNYERSEDSYKELKSYVHKWRHEIANDCLGLKMQNNELIQRIAELEDKEKKRQQTAKSFKRRFWNVVEKVIYGIIIFGIGIFFERISNIW